MTTEKAIAFQKINEEPYTYSYFLHFKILFEKNKYLNGDGKMILCLSFNCQLKWLQTFYELLDMLDLCIQTNF